MSQVLTGGVAGATRAITINTVNDNGTTRNIVSDGGFSGGFRAAFMDSSIAPPEVFEIASDTQPISGIIQEASAPGVGVQTNLGIGGGVRWEASTAFNANAELTVDPVDAAGRCYAGVSGTQIVHAIALTGSTGAGDIVECRLIQFTKVIL